MVFLKYHSNATKFHVPSWEKQTRNQWFKRNKKGNKMKMQQDEKGKDIYIHTQARKLSEKLKRQREREKCSTEYVASIRDKLILSHFDL